MKEVAAEAIAVMGAAQRAMMEAVAEATGTVVVAGVVEMVEGLEAVEMEEAAALMEVGEEARRRAKRAVETVKAAATEVVTNTPACVNAGGLGSPAQSSSTLWTPGKCEPTFSLDARLSSNLKPRTLATRAPVTRL